jgi:DnaK suppressor protein
MPAKKPAPKPAKGKKAASRPAAVKKPVVVVATRKPDEAARRPPPTPLPRRAPTAARKGTPDQSPDTIEDTTATEVPIEMPKAVRGTKKAVTTEVIPAATETDTQEGEDILATARGGSSSQSADSSPPDDDSDGMEPGSLLAGPRNVQPYIVKRGEQYMSQEQLGHFRQILNSWKRDLMVEVDRTVSHMKDEAANFPDPNDRATQEEEFSLELRTRDRERKLIRKIDEALKRIEDGSYGYCLETGEEIGIKRLEARPVATLSIEAQERRERRERQYGDRDDRYR